MGVKENAIAVRGNVSGHAQNVFIAFFKKYPHHQNVFDDYKGKDVDTLKSESSFPIHTTKVLSKLLDIAERCGDGGNLTPDAKYLAKMPQHTTRTIQEYKDLFAVLIPYLSDNLGGACDKTGWENFGKNLVTALQAAM